jgi:hypothetical protein
MTLLINRFALLLFVNCKADICMFSNWIPTSLYFTVRSENIVQVMFNPNAWHEASIQSILVELDLSRSKIDTWLQNMTKIYMMTNKQLKAIRCTNKQLTLRPFRILLTEHSKCILATSHKYRSHYYTFCPM